MLTIMSAAEGPGASRPPPPPVDAEGSGGDAGAACFFSALGAAAVVGMTGAGAAASTGARAGGDSVGAATGAGAGSVGGGGEAMVGAGAGGDEVGGGVGGEEDCAAGAGAAAGEVSLVPEWDAAGEVETGAFDVEDGPGAAAAEEVGGLAAPETEGTAAGDWDEAATARSKTIGRRRAMASEGVTSKQGTTPCVVLSRANCFGFCKHQRQALACVLAACVGHSTCGDRRAVSQAKAAKLCLGTGKAAAALGWASDYLQLYDADSKMGCRVPRCQDPIASNRRPKRVERRAKNRFSAVAPSDFVGREEKRVLRRCSRRARGR
jgi:hypothetical protein